MHKKGRILFITNIVALHIAYKLEVDILYHQCSATEEAIEDYTAVEKSNEKGNAIQKRAINVVLNHWIPRLKLLEPRL